MFGMGVCPEHGLSHATCGVAHVLIHRTQVVGLLGSDDAIPIMAVKRSTCGIPFRRRLATDGTSQPS